MSRVIRRDAETMTISVEDYNLLIAKSNTLYTYVGGGHKLCPSCKQYMLVRGYVCFGCGYDPTDKE